MAATSDEVPPCLMIRAAASHGAQAYRIVVVSPIEALDVASVVTQDHAACPALNPEAQAH